VDDDGESAQKENKKRVYDGDDWDVITMTSDGGVIWRRYRDRKIVTPGDYVKVEFRDEATGIGEGVWVRVTRCDDQKQIVFGILDNEPLNEYEGLGSELAVSFAWIREHRKPTEFTKH
jgi:hypothetical protein